MLGMCCLYWNFKITAFLMEQNMIVLFTYMCTYVHTDVPAVKQS
jgi:hypothetical protein